MLTSSYKGINYTDPSLSVRIPCLCICHKVSVHVQKTQHNNTQHNNIPSHFISFGYYEHAKNKKASLSSLF